MPTDLLTQMAGEWPSPSQFRKSIRLEFAVYLGSIVLLLMLISGAIVTDRLVDTVTQHVVDKLLVQARSYASAAGKHIIAAEGPDALMLTDICRKLASENKELGWVGIASKDNTFLAHTDVRQVISGGSLHSALSPKVEPSIHDGESLIFDKDSIFVVVPVIDQGVLLGRLGLASSAREISMVQRSSIRTVALITALMILLGVPATMFVLSRRLKPLRIITDSLRKIDIHHVGFDIPVKSANEFGYLAETLRVMGARLGTAQKQMLENERMFRELEIAREIQSNILPKTFPSGASFQFAGVYKSAREVGGDYYDFLDLENGKLGFLVADVSGKSLPGMLVMLLTRDLVTRYARRCAEPADLLSRVNRELKPEIKRGMFVTMFYAVLDPSVGICRFASAGHNPLVHVSGGGNSCDLLKTKGFPLGMMEPSAFDHRIESGQIGLNPDDWLIQYTDGINEAMDSKKQEYGMDRFIQAIRQRTGLSANELAAGLLKHNAEFVGEAPPSDDITLVAMKWTGKSSDNVTNEQPECNYAASITK